MDSTQDLTFNASDSQLGAKCDQPVMPIESRILTIRGKQIMIDRDLADLYHVETKVLNQAVKRNSERFPENFRFQLSSEEKEELVTNCDRFKALKHSSVNLQYPYIDLKVYSKAHDRFLIIDDTIYLIGASLKDLGKKLFGFSQMQEMTADELLKRINSKKI